MLVYLENGSEKRFTSYNSRQSLSDLLDDIKIIFANLTNDLRVKLPNQKWKSFEELNNKKG
ncbi:MAG: hypothetical protein BV457_00020 [Thermoplasmata archaeon M9B1D]|nr:MAG: hypothetical protein BV457_00020 [Thermoplasmata archaeon M9B1D]PNX52250.1 MAG: hypothetical protein BV456_00275 [Thermoplasmata archaeon M8B2D]